jgi:hypothetical protein
LLLNEDEGEDVDLGSINGSRSRRRGRAMSFGTGTFGRKGSMILMGDGTHRIIGLRLGEVGRLSFGCLKELIMG